MTDQTPTQDTTSEPVAAEQTPDAPAEVETPTAPEIDTEPDDKPGREAAKYRRQLRDTEAERDALAATVDALQRRMVEEHAGKQITRPEALWAAGVDLADLLDGNGLPDADKIRTACAAASENLGLAAPVGGNYVPNEGRATRTGGTGTATADFAAAFRPSDD